MQFAQSLAPPPRIEALCRLCEVADTRDDDWGTLINIVGRFANYGARSDSGQHLHDRAYVAYIQVDQVEGRVNWSHVK